MGKLKESEHHGGETGNQTKALPTLEERVALLEEENRRLREEIEDVRLKPESLLKPRNAATLLEGLTPTQRSVLESIRQLPSESMDEASRQLNTLTGQPFTEAFSIAISSMMREKKWSVPCGTCNTPASLVWVRGDKYVQGGRVSFSHSDSVGKSVLHKSMTAIAHFKLVPRTDKRSKPKE